MAVGARYFAVDPKFCQFESVGVGLFSVFEGGATPAINRNALRAVAVVDHNGGARYSLAGGNFFAVGLDAVTLVGSGIHKGKDEG